MKVIKSLIIMLAAVSVMASCEKEVPGPVYLDVTANNIAGEWKLVECNGEALLGETYFYIEFVRKDSEYTIYQNFDSMGQLPHVVTGQFRIDTDQVIGAFISGQYNHDGGLWDYEYDVNNLTETSMTWVALGEGADFVQKFERCTIPENLKK